MLYIFLEFRILFDLGYFLIYLLYKSWWFFCFVMFLVFLDVGFFRILVIYYLLILFVILGDGGRLGFELCVVCVCFVRGFGRVVYGAYDVYLFFIGLRVGKFCEWAGSSEVSEILFKILCVNILWFFLGKFFFWRKLFLKG